MIVLNITERGDDLVIVLTPEARAELGAAPGQAVAISSVGDQSSDEARLARGRRFLEKYRSTFEALGR